MDKYDIRNYTPDELKEIVGYPNTNGDDLETLIIEQLQIYMYNRSPSGIQMFQFLKDIYTHFYDAYGENEDSDDDFVHTITELEDVDFDAIEAERRKVENNNVQNETPRDAEGNEIDVYDVSKYSNKELYDLLDLPLNANGEPTQGELEAKLIQQLQLYQNIQTEQGQKMFQFYNDIYKHFFDSGEISDEDWMDNPEVEKTDNDQLFQDQTEVKKDSTKDTKGNIEYTKELDYTKGKINPILKETYKRTISIDSQYRDAEYPSATNFTLNFTETLKDVVSMKLYAVQIPVTWYTISNNYGSNYFFLKPIQNTSSDPMYNTEAIFDNPNHEYEIKIDPGNYTQATLAAEIQTKISELPNKYTDVSFGNTKYEYTTSNAMSKFTFDIQKVYNESYYEMIISGESLKTALGFHDTKISTHGLFSNKYSQLSNNITLTGVERNITIIQYLPTQEYPTYDETNSQILDQINVTLPEIATQEYETLISRTESIIQSNSKILECKITLTKDQEGSSYYLWEIQLNRYETSNVANAKMVLKFDPLQNGESPLSKWNFPSYINEMSSYKGIYNITTGTVTIDESNTITFSPRQNDKGGVYSGSSNNDIVINIPKKTYNTLSDLIDVINTEIEQHPMLTGTEFTINNATNRLNINFNINKIYTTKDYRIVFYDIYSFAKCTNAASSYRNATADTTLGYILGFKELAEYELTSNSIEGEYFKNPDSLTATGSKYTYSDITNNEGNIINTTISLTGDAVLSVFLYNYFMIILDDFNQNHLNDGLVTVAKRDTSVTLPNYANRKNYRACDAVTGEIATSESSSTTFPTQGLTQKQVYSVEQILAEQSRSRDLVNSGPFIKDMFALLPVKASGATPGTIYVEFGGTLQQQERIYFGPVNIRRIAIKLINDKGDVVDLNGANWSFQLVCEQLYQRGK